MAASAISEPDRPRTSRVLDEPFHNRRIEIDRKALRLAKPGHRGARRIPSPGSRSASRDPLPAAAHGPGEDRGIVVGVAIHLKRVFNSRRWLDAGLAAQLRLAALLRLGWSSSSPKPEGDTSTIWPQRISFSTSTRSFRGKVAASSARVQGAGRADGIVEYGVEETEDRTVALSVVAVLALALPTICQIFDHFRYTVTFKTPRRSNGLVRGRRAVRDGSAASRADHE